MSDAIVRLNAALTGRYHVERQLGEGGMATVYLARDEKHNRNVALKVLKPELAAVVGAERFLAEIKTTANLQHPHILPLHDSGEADGLLFYVMPYVEGESLRERLDRERQLSVDDAVRIGTNMAEALDYAHRQGVIHRDIKPANVLLVDGKPVISDFGIALALSSGGGSRLTETGLSMGTPHYMSPEQATGDQRVGPATDIWALGCVLYEMLVGEPPFGGSTPQAVLGKIITGEVPSAKAERSSVPPNVDAVIAKALEKVPADRFSSVGGLGAALSDPAFLHRHVEERPSDPGPWKLVALAASAVAVISLGTLAWAPRDPDSSGASPGPRRFEVAFPEGQEPRGRMVLADDGTALAYERPSRSGSAQEIWIRRWTSLEASPVPGTEGQLLTFAFSPDGRELAVVARDSDFSAPIRIVSLEGGTARTLPVGALGPGVWTVDGSLYFWGGPAGRAISSIPAAGGEAEAVTRVSGEEFVHVPGDVLPDGRTVLYHTRDVSLRDSSAEIWAVDAGTGERSYLTRGTNPLYASTGHLVFVRDGRLMAASLNSATWELSEEVVIAEGLFVDDLGTSFLDLSDDGTLVYMAGESVGGSYQFTWLDRSGRGSPVDSMDFFYPGPFSTVGWQLSPDGTRIAFQRMVEGNDDVWIKQLPDGPFERLTFDAAADRAPFWSPDGLSVTFARDAREPSEPALWERRVDGTEEPLLVYGDLPADLGFRAPPDGEWLVVRAEGDLWAVRPGVDTAATLIQRDAAAPAVSPDGRWIAYGVSGDDGAEIWVQPFPDAGGARWQVSAGGGVVPVWAHGSNELFFVDRDTHELISVEYDTEPTFRARDRRALFVVPPDYRRTSFTRFYDVSRDGQKFLMARYMGSAPGHDPKRIIMVENFFAELRARLPT